MAYAYQPTNPHALIQGWRTRWNGSRSASLPNR